MARETFSLLTWPQRLFLLAFMVAALLLAAIVWHGEQTSQNKAIETTFESDVDKLAQSVAERMRLYQMTLRSSASFWETSPFASRKDWQAYLDRQKLWSNFPGLDALAYAQPVSDQDLDAFLLRMRQEISPDFALQSHSQNDRNPSDLTDHQHIIITHFEPYLQNRDTLLGLDLSQNSTRRDTALQARDSGETVLSPPLQLITAGSTNVDFLMVTPVYKSFFPTSTIEQRRLALQGWVSLGLHGNSLAQTLFGTARTRGYDAHLLVSKADGQLISIDDHPDADPSQPRLSSERTLIIAGQSWLMRVHSTPKLESQVYRDPWSSLIANILLALALSAGAYLLLISRQQSRLLAVQTLQQLNDRERHYQSVVEGTVEGYWQIDPITRQTVAVNSSLCTMLGYERHEIIGHSPTRFCAPELVQDFSQQIDSLWSREHRVYDITLIRKDGSPLIAHIAASTLRDENGAIDSVFAMVTDITDATMLRNALTEKTRALESSNSDLQQFAYVASHDLQAPLRVVSSYLQLLERRYGNTLDKEAHEFIDFAVQGARRMSRLINDLLTFSRVETAGERMQPTRLPQCIRQALTNLAVSIEARQATIDVPSSMPPVMGDTGQITSLFQNLVGNALKYCPDERPPHVVITASLNHEMVEIDIADNGIGIPPDQYTRIFLIFQRLHGPEEYEGTGIGLALVKRILERHKGRVWITPNHRADGTPEGTIFHVCLPAAPTDSKDDEDKGALETLYGPR